LPKEKKVVFFSEDEGMNYEGYCMYFFSNHASNYLPVKAKFPGGKQKALDLIDAALRGEVGLKPRLMRPL
jgi:hypothetical protein